MLGKRILIGPTGLPTKIEAQRTHRGPWRQVLGAPVDFSVKGITRASNTVVTFQPASKMSVMWQSVTNSSEGSLVIDGELDCTGYMSFNATLTNLAEFSHDGVVTQTGTSIAVNLTVPNAPTNAHFGMGLGQRWAYQIVLIGAPPLATSLVVYDFDTNFADGIRLFSHGDGVHDPWHMYLQGKGSGRRGFTWSGAKVTPLIGQASGGQKRIRSQ